jgi:hypothetical protein
VFLVVRVKVRLMMGLSGLKIHSDDDAKESRELRHATNLPSSGPACLVSASFSRGGSASHRPPTDTSNASGSRFTIEQRS